MKKSKFLKMTFVMIFGLTLTKVSTIAKADTIDNSADQTTQTITDSNQIVNQIQNDSNQAKTNKTVANKKAAKQNKVVSVAKSKLGKRYVWGATGPNAFDCSGLAQYAYRKGAKVSLPRTTYSQVNRGKRVSLKHLQKGDLLFWGSTSSPYHVGIYAGNGQYIHAATPSQGVIKAKLSHYFYPSCAKRIIK